MEFPPLKTPAIIALKGLPVTHKSAMALLVARWAKSPVLFIEDILAPGAGGSGNSASPSMDEAQHLLRRAFDALCAVAERHVRCNEFNCVVIKSRLCTTFELDRLIDLMIRCDSHALLIIDCQFSNKYVRQLHFNQDYLKNKRWCKLKTWNEVEMAGEEYDAQAWDLHFTNSIATLPEDKRRNVRRLMFDVSSDAAWSGGFEQGHIYIAPHLSAVILSLLSEEMMVQLPNTVVYHDFRRALVEWVLNPSRQKSNKICTGGNRCIFNYVEACEAGVYCCRVCEKPISGPSYECFRCNMALHKSCAGEPAMVNRLEGIPYLDLFDETVQNNHFDSQCYRFTGKHACDPCRESGKPFSYECGSCLLYTHLKCRLMPTIVKHDCHPEHFLQVQLQTSSEALSNDADAFNCRGCSHSGFYNSYTCCVCGHGYHTGCVAAPREVKHEHGGYEHVMRLMYSFADMEEQEDFWCDICHKDLDPTTWFYRCKECHYYISHMDFPSRLPCEDARL